MNKQNRHINPPGWPLWLLRTCLSSEYLEEIEGDMEERFRDNLKTLSIKKANLLYTWDAIKLLRPALMSRMSGDRQLNHYGMFKNFVKTGYRNLIRQKEYTLLNSIGLAIGLTMTMLTSLWVWDELSFDKNHQNYEKIAQVLKRRTHNGETDVRYSLPIPVVDELRYAYAEDFKYVVVADWIGKNTLSSEEKSLNVSGCYMSEHAPAMLSLKMLKGTRHSLSNKHGIMLTKRTAEAFFDSRDPIGEHLKINGESSMQIVGVYEDLPAGSTFQDLKFVANFSVIEANSTWVQRARSEKFWDANFCQVYVQLSQQADLRVVEEKIKSMISSHSHNEQLLASNPELVLHAMKDWHLRSGWKNGVQSGGAITNVWIFGLVALFVLILSCFNFINLSTARAQVRFKEVGVRKTMGSSRVQLIAQFMTESFLLVALAFFVALIMAYWLMPLFNNLSGKNLTIPLFNPWFWSLSSIVLIATGLLAGSYPAFFLSSFRPVQALRGTLIRQGSSDYLRHGLVVVQFAVSICLIVGTLVVNNQVMHSKNRDKGYDPTRLITINTSTKDFDGKHEVLHTALMSTGIVDAMSQSSSPLTEVTSSNNGFSWKGKDPELATNFITIRVTPEFGKTVRWKILDGRDFSGERRADEKALVCNQAAIDFMSLETPVGLTINWRGEAYSIIGVVDDLLIESPFQAARPAVYFIDPSKVAHMQIRLSEHVDSGEALAKLEEALQSVVPNIPLDFQYVDQTFASKFIQEERLGTLLGILTIAAMVIGMLGIFGLTAYVIRQRSKEMSIRKVLGASLVSILSLLFSDFIKTILVALVISVPIAWYLLDQWLQGYEYRIDFSLWYFVITSVFFILLTLAIVGQRSLQVAFSNPTKYLKEE